MIHLYYHAGSSNHGCEAIVRSTDKLLNSDITLWSMTSDSDVYYGLDNIVNIKADQISALSHIDSLKFKIHHKLHGTDYLYTKYSHKELFNAVQPGDLWFSIGGDNYCYNGIDILGHYNQIIHEKGGKTILWGCSIAPDILTQEVIMDLKRYDLITVRESMSLEGLKQAGITENVVFCSDPAFQLDKAAIQLPDGFCAENTVGINVSPLVMQCGNLVLENYEALIKHILTTTDFNVALIPHVVIGDNDDRMPLRALSAKFKSDRIITIEDHNCMELKGIISQCRMFIGARTHATIAAYSTCVPTLVAGYSIKARGIAKDLFGTDEHYVIPVQAFESENSLTESFKWLAANEENIRAYLKETIPGYSQRSYIAVDAVRKLMQS